MSSNTAHKQAQRLSSNFAQESLAPVCVWYGAEVLLFLRHTYLQERTHVVDLTLTASSDYHAVFMRILRVLS